eukprot:3168105-Ditylum_brightwellii.AAC.1
MAKQFKKLKWYGGLVTDISPGGKLIQIKYDDRFLDVANFPDKDILVDCTSNGRHRASALQSKSPHLVPHRPKWWK